MADPSAGSGRPSSPHGTGHLAHTFTEHEFRSMVGAAGKMAAAVRRLLLIIEVAVWVAAVAAAVLLATHPLFARGVADLPSVLSRVAVLVLLCGYILYVQRHVSKDAAATRSLDGARRKRARRAGVGMSSAVMAGMTRLMTEAGDATTSLGDGASEVASEAASAGGGIAGVVSEWLQALEAESLEACGFDDPAQSDALLYADTGPAAATAPLLVVKGTVRCPPRAFVEFVAGMAPAAVAKLASFDDSVAEMRCVEQPQGGSAYGGGAVTLTRLSFPWPCTDRELVFRTDVVPCAGDDDAFYIVQRDVC